MNGECLFCKIVNKELDADIVYEDADSILFKDINPQAPVHFLFIPKKHIPTLNEISVDDNEINREILFKYIESWGSSATLAENGNEALKIMMDSASQGKKFDIAIIDMVMPEMNGIELANKIKGNPSLSSTKLIMLTSYGNRGDSTLIKEAGIDAYFNKPIGQSDLYNTIISVLGSQAKADKENKKK